ncbi:hypothetical protein Q5P01_026139 [Channa striata]|uniref:Uncharacterized protein n=1 Tax=Channa striata TaxID=64152 RepID=A0AA88LK77_CHASR|nr:hypothetical protein Q5P01_026139 [Channa striata]
MSRPQGGEEVEGEGEGEVERTKRGDAHGEEREEQWETTGTGGEQKHLENSSVSGCQSANISGDAVDTRYNERTLSVGPSADLPLLHIPSSIPVFQDRSQFCSI